MTEIDYLKCKLEDTEKAFDKLHKRHIELLKQQGKLEKENEQLKQSNDRFADTVAKQVSLLIELKKENEQLHHELQQIKEYLQTKIDECKNHKKMKEIVFDVEQAVGYEKALLQFQKGLKRRLNNE